MKFWSKLRIAWAKTTIVNKLTFALTVVIAGANIAYVVFASKQFHTMNGQLEQMKRGTVATLQSAHAACVSAQISRSALLALQASGADTHALAVGSLLQAAAVTRAEAAEITIASPENRITFNVVDGKMSLPTTIRNVGKTAALNMYISAQIKVVRVGVDKTLGLRLEEGSQTHLKMGAFAPNIPIPFKIDYLRNGRDVVLDHDESAKLTGTSEFVVTYGRITFHDVFDAPHEKKFCFIAEFNPLVWKPYAEECTAYNTTDVSKPAPEAPKLKIPVPPAIDCPAPKDDK